MKKTIFMFAIFSFAQCVGQFCLAAEDSSNSARPYKTVKGTAKDSKQHVIDLINSAFEIGGVQIETFYSRPKDDPEKAVSLYREALRIDPKMAWGYYGLAIHSRCNYESLYHCTTGIRDIDKAIKLKPRVALFYIIRANLLKISYTIQRHEDALPGELVKLCRRASQCAPKWDLSVHVFCANAYAWAKMDNEKEQALARADLIANRYHIGGPEIVSLYFKESLK